MKRLIGVLVMAISLLFVAPVYADVNNFYFSDFTGDYYLSKDTTGVSRLKVIESVTAEFPSFNQNKGICRQIPFTNQDGANVTLPSLTRENIKVTRNGAAETIYSIKKEGNYYNVCTGTEEYVTGSQVYKFEYEFEKVVTDFEDYQELYWDTNGNGAKQKFDKVTARVHFEDEGVWSGKSWCYVGKYGQSGQDRCQIAKISDGVEFMAENLSSYENLTFDVELLAGSYVVPPPEKDYTDIWIMVGAGVLGVVWAGLTIKKYLQSRPKKKYYKSLFVKPEYQPNRKYSLAEMAEIYLGKKKDVKVAMLLELATTRKIELKKGEKKKWSILVKKDVAGEYADLLAILNGGTQVKVGDVIEVRRQTASNRLLTLKKTMDNKILGDLKRDGLVEDNYRIGYKRWKYLRRTNKGLEMARYMDGLELYIKMAEAERLKFLQSVKGADTSADGIVKLYEKLLPYAAVFGLEESWMNEMKEYCKVEEIEEPDYLMRGMTAWEVSRMVQRTATYAAMASSGGGSSSGYSGGGGGGFSGGGGGGGGFGGR